MYASVLQAISSESESESETNLTFEGGGGADGFACNLYAVPLDMSADDCPTPARTQGSRVVTRGER
jgi:hypothetical protein